MSRASWLEWRKKGIGASDCPAIMGCSPYKDIIQIWKDKTSEEPVVEMTNRILEKGNELEPIARAQFAAHYNLLNGTDETFEPALVELKDAPFMRASLDGRSKDGSIILEIKYIGKDSFDKVKGKMPLIDIRKDYWVQMQHQFLCSSAKRGFFCVINDTKIKGQYQVAWIEVSPEPEYMREIFVKCAQFWDCVETKTLPSVDYGVAASAEPEFEKLEGWDKQIEEWKKLKLEIDEKTEQLEKLREKIMTAVNKPKMFACGVTFVQQERAGAVDYKKIPELKGVDLEKYRKPPTKFYKMEIKG